MSRLLATAQDDEPAANEAALMQQGPLCFQADGFTARVVRSEEGDGWAVSLTRDGDDEPCLWSPWQEERGTQQPKPLDARAFEALVKRANELHRRHAQELRARLYRSVTVTGAQGTRIKLELEIVPDEDDPHAILTVHHEHGPERTRVDAGFKLTPESAAKWLDAF